LLLETPLHDEVEDDIINENMSVESNTRIEEDNLLDTIRTEYSTGN
jgi:hypothetical protein